MYDVVILGAGPAGITAAIYAQRAGLNFLLIEKNMINGGQIINAQEIENYPGFFGEDGFALTKKWQEHCTHLGISTYVAEVEKIDYQETGSTIWCSDQTEIKTRAIVFATGTTYQTLGVAGEKEWKGRGVSYCATCDGAFFRNRVVAVVGGGNVAVEDALFLSELCKKVYVIHRRGEFRADQIEVTKLFLKENVEVIWNHTVQEILGKERVTQVRVKENESQIEQVLQVDGIFIAIGTRPNQKLYQNLLETDEKGYIVADETGKTNQKWLYAAGDVRTKQVRQVITAAADGANVIAMLKKELWGDGNE